MGRGAKNDSLRRAPRTCRAKQAVSRNEKGDASAAARRRERTVDMGIHLMLPVTDRQCLANLHRRVRAPGGQLLHYQLSRTAWLRSGPGEQRDEVERLKRSLLVLFVPHAPVWLAPRPAGPLRSSSFTQLFKCECEVSKRRSFRTLARRNERIAKCQVWFRDAAAGRRAAR